MTHVQKSQHELTNWQRSDQEKFFSLVRPTNLLSSSVQLV